MAERSWGRRIIIGFIVPILLFGMGLYTGCVFWGPCGPLFPPISGGGSEGDRRDQSWFIEEKLPS